MVGIEITREDMTAGELRQASGRARGARAARRMLALALVLEGVDRATAARSCGMDRQTLRDWVHRYNAEGLSGLENRKSSGRPAKLAGPEEQALIALVEAGPDAATDKIVRWRRSDLRDKLEAQCGVTVHERTVGKHLAKLGYRRLSVRPYNPKADPDAQAAFKKTSPTT
jgi:transposase